MREGARTLDTVVFATMGTDIYGMLSDHHITLSAVKAGAQPENRSMLLWRFVLGSCTTDRRGEFHWMRRADYRWRVIQFARGSERWPRQLSPLAFGFRT